MVKKGKGHGQEIIQVEETAYSCYPNMLVLMFFGDFQNAKTCSLNLQVTRQSNRFRILKH